MTPEATGVLRTTLGAMGVLEVTVVFQGRVYDVGDGNEVVVGGRVDDTSRARAGWMWLRLVSS